ncbi:MAG: FliM/FliN family flagellar motor switch protein, partial [Pseudomonadota bacterium]
RGGLSLGTSNFTVSEVRDLSPGDIVICPVGARRDAVELRLAGRVRTLTRSDQGWTIGAARMDDPSSPSGSTAEAAPSHRQAEPETSNNLHDLPVRLEFYLGGITLPLSAVETLSEQSILPLEAVAVEGVPVTLRANGTAIAEGDLVQLDDRLGVRLTRVGVHPVESPTDAPATRGPDDAL